MKRRLILLMILGIFSFSAFGQSDNNPDDAAILYNQTKDNPVPEHIDDSLSVAFENLKKACSELIALTIPNTYEGIKKDAKNLKKKIEKTKVYKDISNSETVKGVKKDIQNHKKTKDKKEKSR